MGRQVRTRYGRFEIPIEGNKKKDFGYYDTMSEAMRARDDALAKMKGEHQ